MRLNFLASAEEVRHAMTLLHALVTDWGLADADADTAEIVLGEVLNNVVEHGYGACNSGEISLDLHCNTNTLECRISDVGARMSEAVLTRVKKPTDICPRKNLPEGGFGWMLIHRLARDICYCRIAGRNHLTFSVPLTAWHGPPRMS